MKTNLLMDGKVLHLEFDTKIQMNSKLFRIAEFLDSPYEEIKGKYFTFEQFVKNYVDENGNLNYFGYWEGVNFSKKLLAEFLYKFNSNETEFEKELCFYPSYQGVSYFIATLKGDEGTLAHELAHAKYDLEPIYKHKMNYVFNEIQFNLKSRIIIDLGKLYSEEVIPDETQAYLLTSDDEELNEMLPSCNLSALHDLQEVYKDAANS